MRIAYSLPNSYSWECSLGINTRFPMRGRFCCRYKVSVCMCVCACVCKETESKRSKHKIRLEKREMRKKIHFWFLTENTLLSTEQFSLPSTILYFSFRKYCCCTIRNPRCYSYFQRIEMLVFLPLHIYPGFFMIKGISLFLKWPVGVTGALNRLYRGISYSVEVGLGT